MAKAAHTFTRIEHGPDIDDRPQLYFTDPDVGHFLTELEDLDNHHRMLAHTLDAAMPDDLKSPSRAHSVIPEDAEALRWGTEQLGWQIRRLRAKFSEILATQHLDHVPAAKLPA